MIAPRADTAAARAEAELAERRAAFDRATADAEAHGPEADLVDLIDCALALHAAETVLGARSPRPG
jgi:hypothetical protein